MVKTPNDFKLKTFIFKSFLYLLQLCEFDQDIILRDRARFLKNLLLGQFETNSQKNQEYDEIYKNIYNFSEERFLLIILLKNLIKIN